MHCIDRWVTGVGGAFHRVPWRLAAYYQEMPDDRVKPALLALAAFFERQPEVGVRRSACLLTSFPAASRQFLWMTARL